MGDTKQYKHIISLGYFCSIAQDGERYGFRSASMPFDWLISSWEGVERLISNKFKDFLKYELLNQVKTKPERYKNIEYNITFFHDFNKYKSLASQLKDCQIKYERRIQRFFENICEPTLFIRYIMNKEEQIYLAKNIDHITKMLRSFNKSNDIIFISSTEVITDKLTVFYIEKDENDIVSRKPFEKNRFLYAYLKEHYSNDVMSRNVVQYDLKVSHADADKLYRKIMKKSYKMVKEKLIKPYRHDKIID